LRQSREGRFTILFSLKNEARHSPYYQKKNQREIFNGPDSCWNIFPKNLRASAKVYTPVFGFFAALSTLAAESVLGQDFRSRVRDKFSPIKAPIRVF